MFTLGLQIVTQASMTPGGISSGTPLFLFYDAHGSTRLLIDDSLTIQGIYRYDAYGNAIGFDPTTALTSHLYNGEQFDALIGLYYLQGTTMIWPLEVLQRWIRQRVC